ncbi:MAG: tRNA (N(6)-L-threonylcarbamoyladenosine(37)-C(2))-methylthiotransferase MtaB, partial [Planctomycetota bacterium]|nr:tRNA (N(6)-L-threonylcarbamoyladenosine(37)-C(2))-methylthiotransferase MtaB [Planctomycetota bacterium]
MRTFSIITLGCKVNQYESQQVRQLLEQLGLEQVEEFQKPDLVIVNTCCVTGTASAKSRQYIRKVRRLSPDAVTLVCGCLPIAQIGELNVPGKNIHLVRQRDNLAAILTRMVNGPPCLLSKTETGADLQGAQIYKDIIRPEKDSNINCKNELGNLLTSVSSVEPKLTQLTSFTGQTRAFLKVQDGCDGYCTYCIVPKVRPFVHSKPVEAALQEAQALVEAGHREIVVTGIFLGAYGQESVRRKTWANQQNDQLADLLDKMAEIPNLARIRLSSLEPADVTPRLVDTFCKHPNIMPHLHLSLQSGSDKVLKKMGRQYSADEFRQKVALVKSRLDRPAITTDIIVGFPGETDADFQQTVDLAKEVGFAKMHIFSFSPRKGTAAAVMQDAVDNRVIKERAHILRDLEVELGKAFRRQFVGETA